MADGPALKRDRFGIEIRLHKAKPYNYGLTSDVVRHTDKAVQVAYYSWLLWLPKKACRRVDGQLYSSIKMINAAKDHDSAERS